MKLPTQQRQIGIVEEETLLFGAHAIHNGSGESSTIDEAVLNSRGMSAQRLLYAQSQSCSKRNANCSGAVTVSGNGSMVALTLGKQPA
jgi:hypothetical protein